MKILTPLYRALSMILLSVGMTGCANINLPAVTQTPSNTQLEGKIIWHDLISDKPLETIEFYHKLFGWEFENLNVAGGLFGEINYTLIRHNGKIIGGLIDQTKLKTSADISQWVVLMSVKNINKAVDEIKSAGGTVFTPATDLGDRGQIAIVADPQGALLAFLQTKQGDPLDEDTIEAGNFLWNELWTSDVDAATKFYKGVANYDVEDRDIEQENSNKKQYRLLKSSNKPRVGVLLNPIENLKPIWVSYLRIADNKSLDDIVNQVESLGGQVLLSPQDREIGGRVALIAGPSGAGIALQTWPDKNLSTAKKTVK